MALLPVAVTAAAALSAAGEWTMPAHTGRSAGITGGGQPIRWPAASLIPSAANSNFTTPTDSAQPCHWPLAQIPSEVAIPEVTLDRATNIGLLLADRILPGNAATSRFEAHRIGVAFTISKGGFGIWADAANGGSTGGGGAAQVAEARWAIQAADGAAGAIAHRLRVTGARISPVAACATGIADFICGARLLQTEPLDAVACGASESSLHPLLLHSFDHMGILDRAPMRPFDESRHGFNLGEGGAIFLMEPVQAKQDVPPPLGYLTAAALIADAHHMTELHPQRPTLTRLIRQLLNDRRTVAPRRPLESLYINAHGTGTPLNDPWESQQLIEAFGHNGWARTGGWLVPDAPVVISGTKALAGHLLGASALFEAFLCLAVLNGSPPPPTWNLQRPHAPWPMAMQACPALQLLGDPAWDRPKITAAPFDAAMTLNYGFGGHVGGALFERGGNER